MAENLEIRVTPNTHGTGHNLMLDGEEVSGLSIYDLTMRVGVASVRMGGIAGVWTADAHRKKGYARRVLEHSNRWMAENGFDCATLMGIPDFYDKFGYVVCMASCRFEVKTRDAERASTTSLRVRPFSDDDLPVVRDIYHETNADQTGSVVRDKPWPWFVRGSWYDYDTEVFVFTEETGGIAAYAVRDRADDRVTICEVGARTPNAFGDILSWAAERAVALRVETIGFHVPSESLFGEYITRFGAEQTLVYTRCSKFMGRLIQFDSFLEKTLPEWTRRAAASSLSPGTSVRLETDMGNATLRWTGCAVEREATAEASGVVRLPQRRLMQLAMGYHSPRTALTFSDTRAEGDLSLLHTLFPRRPGWLWSGDYF